MQNSNQKIVHAVISSVIVTILFITLITIIADIVPPLKNWLKVTFTHHWIGKGILAILLFAIFSLLSYFISPESHTKKITQHLLVLFWLTIFGIFAIFGFFLFETLS